MPTIIPRKPAKVKEYLKGIEELILENVQRNIWHIQKKKLL
jgi:hypothetical protein